MAKIGLTVTIEPFKSKSHPLSPAMIRAIIIETIKYIQILDGAPSRTNELQKHMEQMLEGFQFHHYTDPESGLLSINHFVLN